MAKKHYTYQEACGGEFGEYGTDTPREPVIKAAQIAEELGNAKAMNVVLFGALVKAMGLTDIDWEEMIRSHVKANAVEVNLRALKAGMNI